MCILSICTNFYIWFFKNVKWNFCNSFKNGDVALCETKLQVKSLCGSSYVAHKGKEECYLTINKKFSSDKMSFCV